MHCKREWRGAYFAFGTGESAPELSFGRTSASAPGTARWRACHACRARRKTQLRHDTGGASGWCQQLTRAAWYVTQVDRAVPAAPLVRHQIVDASVDASVYLLRGAISVDRLSRLSDFAGFRGSPVDRRENRRRAKTLYFWRLRIVTKTITVRIVQGVATIVY